MIGQGQAGEEEVQEADASGGKFPEVADCNRKRKRKPPKKEFHRFGNYHHYYGYRLDKTLDEDPRLKFLERDWFEGKDCLDIGCNEGVVTISIAQKYNCRSILGVDIDKVLIKKAKGNLNDEAAAFEELDGGGDVEKEWWKETIAWRDLQVEVPVDGKVEHKESATEFDQAITTWYSFNFRRSVTFRTENFIEDFPHGNYMKDGTFDTVLCFSMTKWVHLNWGDEGLIRLFAKIYHILRPGGIFILEPQPWKSYKKKHQVCEVTRNFFNVIQIRPRHFTEILLDKIGFKSYRQVSTSVPGSIAGFDRSLFLYSK